MGTATRVRAFSAGAINDSFYVRTRTGNYVLRVYKRKADHEIGFELALLSHMKRLPIPQVVRVNGKEITNVGSSSAIVYRYIPGKTLARHTKSEREQVGRFLARFHKRAKGFWYHGKRDALYDFSEQKVQQFSRAVRAARVPHRERFLVVADDIRRYQLDRKLPRGPIHADVKPDNVLFQNRKLSGVIDFDNAYIGPYILDLAKSMAWFGLNGGMFSKAQAADVYRGYISERKLTPLEYAELHRAVLFAFASHLFVDFYMRAVKGIPHKYFTFLMRDFWSAYQSLTLTPKEFYASL